MRYTFLKKLLQADSQNPSDLNEFIILNYSEFKTICIMQLLEKKGIVKN